jgi:hypothetical protein
MGFPLESAMEGRNGGASGDVGGEITRNSGSTFCPPLSGDSLAEGAG